MNSHCIWVTCRTLKGKSLFTPLELRTLLGPSACISTSGFSSLLSFCRLNVLNSQTLFVLHCDKSCVVTWSGNGAEKRSYKTSIISMIMKIRYFTETSNTNYINLESKIMSIGLVRCLNLKII